METKAFYEKSLKMKDTGNHRKNKKDHRIDRRTEHTEQEVLQAQQKRTGGRSFVFRLDWQCLVRFFLY